MSENTKKTDPRKVRTQALLREALIALMQEKPLEKISVKNLIERAQITRSTFYLHYLDKDDFIDKTITQVLAEYEKRVQYFDELPYSEAILKRGKVFFEYMSENADFYRAMLGSNGVPAFRIRLQQIGLNYFYKRYLPPMQNSANFEYNHHLDFAVLANYIVSAKIGCVDYWLNSGMKLSPDFLAQRTSDFVYTLLKRYNIVKA